MKKKSKLKKPIKITLRNGSIFYFDHHPKEKMFGLTVKYFVPELIGKNKV